VLVNPLGTPASPGNTRPTGETEAAGPVGEQSEDPKAPRSGSEALNWQGYTVDACPGRNACTRCQADRWLGADTGTRTIVPQAADSAA